jgi:hypothetical protein
MAFNCSIGNILVFQKSADRLDLSEAQRGRPLFPNRGESQENSSNASGHHSRLRMISNLLPPSHIYSIVLFRERGRQNERLNSKTPVSDSAHFCIGEYLLVRTKDLSIYGYNMPHRVLVRRAIDVCAGTSGYLPVLPAPPLL